MASRPSEAGRRSAVVRAALLLAGVLSSGAASATPITISNAGYWLETVGSNTIGIAGGGSANGVVTTLFVANTAPGPDQGTTATANFGGIATTSPGLSDPSLWTRRVLNPDAFQLQALTVDFANGGDTASFTGRALNGITAMPLAQNLAVDGSANPYKPRVSWTVPDTPGIDIDLIQLVFYSNATNLEVGGRPLLSPPASGYTLTSAIPPGFDLTINVRFIDLADDAAPFTTGNILSESRAYINYTTPVPEPASALLFGAGALGLAAWRRRSR